MAMTTYTGDTDYIASLDDLPNDVGGLTAAQFKAKFDQFGTEFVAWFNATHLPELTAVNVGAPTADLGDLAIASLDTYTTPGYGNVMDSGGTFGFVGALYELEVMKSAFNTTNTSVVQRLTRTYPVTDPKCLERIYYTVGGWSSWYTVYTSEDKPTSADITPSSAYNESHLIMGSYHLWVDASGKLRIKSSAPSSDTDGTIVGTQS